MLERENMLTNVFQDRVRAADGPVQASFPGETG